MFSQLLDGITFEVKSPDGKISLELEDGLNVTMDIAVGVYRRYPEHTLQQQLSGLIGKFWSAHKQAHLMMLSELAGYQVRDRHIDTDRRTREFLDERAAIRVEGASQSGHIRVTGAGLSAWSVQIKPRTVRELTEGEFLNGFWTAFAAATRDYARKVAVLKKEVLTVPAHYR
ncbi:MAG: hypothetical protein ACRDT6_16750 [Micromonosporaceae bacterium]